MLSKKDVKIALFVIACILLNLAGKQCARFFQLPLWLDSFGTVFSAYLLGPVSGAIVGVTMNLAYSNFSPFSYMYGLTSIAIGVSVGIAARRKLFDSFLVR